MADAQLKLSRRTLLGVACAAPFSPSPSLPRKRESIGSPDQAGKGLDPRFRGDDVKWQRALARFRSAEAALKALEGDPDEDAYGRAHDRFNLAFRRLVASPAAGLAALADKLEIAAAAEAAETTYAPPDLAALAHDARTLVLQEG